MKVESAYIRNALLLMVLASGKCLYAQTTVTTSGGTANTIPVFTGSSTIGTTTSFPLTLNSTSQFLGIGTTSPGYTLDVAGDINFTGTFRYQGSPIVQSIPSLADFFLVGSGNTTMTGCCNAGFGASALGQNTTGEGNVAVGESALYSNTTGSESVAFGRHALAFSTTSYYNTAVGTYAAEQNTTGQGNTVAGQSALRSNTTGWENSAFGHISMANLVGGYYNTSIGSGTLISLQTGDSNTAVGADALTGLTTGEDNIAIGDGAGDDQSGPAYNTSATQSIYLGASSMSLQSGDSNEIVIGAYATGAGSNTVTLGNTSIASTVLRGTVTMPSASITGAGAGITFPDGTVQRTAASGSGGSSSGSTSVVTLGTVTTGTWNAAPITSTYLPSDVDYTDQAQTITGQKSFTSNVGIGVATGTTSQLLQVGSTYSQNPGIMIGGHDSNNASVGNYSLLFGAWRDIEPTITSGIVATPTWTCCNGYPASGYAGIRENSLGFYTIYDPASPTSYSPNMQISANGNVGIGTTTPGSLLEVNGNVKLTAGSGASVTYPDGTVQATAWNGTTLGGDYAESVDVLGERTSYEPGDVIVIDDSESGKFVKSTQPYSRLVAGVYSTKPGLVGRRTTADRPDKEAEVPMAMMGIVPTKVSTENGPIERGDLLVSSSIPGYAMKGTDSSRMMGTVIGKALAPLKTTSGVIDVLVSLQ
jgi:hypothetical protein